MKIERYDLPIHPYRYAVLNDGPGYWCRYSDVARLEASHAELLEAAKEIIRWWDGTETAGGYSRIDRLRAAIAKAEGEVMP